MKNAFFFLVIIFTLVSCEKEQITSNEVNTLDLVSTGFNLKAQPQYDNVKEGLYRGIFSTYDLSLKGEIVLDLGNSEKIQAVVKLIQGGESFKMEGYKDTITKGTYTFNSDRGTFKVTINPDGKIRLDHFNFDGKDAYIVAYKETSLVDIIISLGHYTEDGDASRNGNWDAINKGATYTSPPAHSTTPTQLTIIEEIILTKGGNIFINSDGTSYNDNFLESCFYNDTFQHGYYFETVGQTYKELIGYNQTSTFAGRVCTWSLSYYLFNGVFIYDTPTCGLPDASGYGSWSWDGRTGKIYVDRLGPF